MAGYGQNPYGASPYGDSNVSGGPTQVRVSQLTAGPNLGPKIRVSQLTVSSAAPPVASGPRVRVSRVTAFADNSDITIDIQSSVTPPIISGKSVTLTFSGASTYAVSQTEGLTVQLSGSGNTRTFNAPFSSLETTLTFKVIGSVGSVSNEKTISIAVLRHQVWIASQVSGANLVWQPA